MAMQPWQRIGEPRLVFEGWRRVYEKTFRMNNGATMVAQIGDKDGWLATAVVALTKDNKVVIARQFRCGPELVMDELPGGAVDEGEAPIEAAGRELLEETGYKADKIVEIGQVYKHAWVAAKWHYFLATDCEAVEHGNNPEEHEEVEVDLISIDQLIANAKTGKMTDTEAVFLAYDKLMELKHV